MSDRSSTGLQRSALICAVWALLALGSLALAAGTEGTVVSTALLPDPLRRTLVGFELCLLAALVAGVGGGLMGLWRLLSMALPRRVAWVLVSVAASLPLGLYGISWVTFRSTDRFLDSNGIDFMSASPVQFMQHVAHIEPQLLVVVPLALAGVTIFFTAIVPAMLARLSRPMLLGIHVTTAVLLASCVLFASTWKTGNLADAVDYIDPLEAVVDPNAGLIYNHNDLYLRSRDDASGPLSHAYADYRQMNAELSLHVDTGIEVEYAPIISLSEYLATVDPAAVRKNNVLLVVIESLRPDQLMSFGGSREVMPTVEAIAGEARLFPDHYAQASHSNYADICLLSSHYPLRSERAHVYPKNPTYPRVPIYDLLKGLGWHTAVVSSQNESWGQMINYLRTGSIDHFFHSETFEGETYVPRNDEGFEDFLTGGKRSGKIDDRFTVSEAIRWIDSIEDEAPFFMYLNLQNSHLPYETPADFDRPFGPDEIDFVIKFSGYPQEQAGVAKDMYSDSLAYVDSQLGRLVQHLKSHGSWDDTLVVVTGDTGQAFGEHGFVAHANMIFEETVRVPLIVKSAELEPGVDPRPAQHVDLPPTILDLLGLPPHPGLQGISLASEDPHSNRYRYIMVQTPIAHQYGLVWNRFKLIDDVNYDRRLLLDRNLDPTEMNPVGRKHPALQAKLRARLDTWRRLQLDYYSDTQLHSERYPPRLAD
jgi:arylsulfatase A-like enzyme